MHCYRQKDNGMYILSRADIEEIATDRIQKFAPSNLERPTPLKTRDFLEDALGLVVKYKYICDFDSGILGMTVMGDMIPVPSYDELLRPTVFEETFGTVLITPHLLGKENTPRRRYTEMHEASHFMLHQPYFFHKERMLSSSCDNNIGAFVACRKIEIRDQSPKTDAEWLEFQADALAAAMLMPQNVFVAVARDVMRKHGVRNNCLYYNPHIDQPKMHCIIYEIAETFVVSYQAAKIRMQHLGLLRDSSYCY